jgi:hypothetical protein
MDMKMTKEKKVKKMIATERQEQIALVHWAKLKSIDLVHHCNEGKRSLQEGRALKRSGLSSGYPDLSLSEARGGYFGLFIEVKQKREYTDSEKKSKTWLAQSEWLTHLANEHYFSIRIFGWEHGKEIIEMYMSWPRTLFTPFQVPITNIPSKL